MSVESVSNDRPDEPDTKNEEQNTSNSGTQRYRKRRRPLVGPTGCPYLDEALLEQTKACKWFRTSKSTDIVKKVAFRDEAIISMSVAGEVTDSSIVEMGRSRPQFQYTRDELMVIRTMPSAKRRPACLDIAYNNSRGVWDPERWHLDRKRSETPSEEEQQRSGNKSDQPTEIQNNKRRSGDPRERIRKEQDGIVLSPQRRSFNSGCFVNVTQPSSRRPESPIGKTEVSHREPVRRIGSGRLLARDMWDFRPETDKLEPEREFTFRSSGNSTITTRDRDNRDGGRERDGLRDRDNIRDREDRIDRYERRSFGRDFGDRDNQRDRGSDLRNDRGHDRGMDRDKERGGRDRKYGSDRRKSYANDSREIEEPEWFSSGPISQHDTIELHGFDDVPEERSVNIRSKKQSPAQKKRGKRAVVEKEEKTTEPISAGPKGRSTPTALDQPINPVPAPHSPILEQEESPPTNGKIQSETSESVITEPSESTDRSDASKSREAERLNFNLDDFLKSDNLPGVSGLLTNGVGTNNGSGSRFSQWFKKESPLPQEDSRRPSIQDELLNNLLNDITEPNIQVPSVTESNTYFAPISPANPTNIIGAPAPPAPAVKLLEMLQRGKLNQNGQGDVGNNMQMPMKNPSIKDMEVGGKVVHSVEELEARMRGGMSSTPHIEPARTAKTEEDLSAFKKLLAQVTGGQAVPAANGPNPPKGQPITLMQLLKNQQVQSAMQGPPHPSMMPEPQPHPQTYNHVGPLGPTQHAHQAQMQHENLLKVLRIQQQQQQQQQQKQRQQQTDMLSMMMGNQRMVGVSPIPQEMQMLVNNAPSSRELLQRPEAQAIIQGLQQGEITRQHLIQQLQNPAMQHRHREVLANILKMYGNTTPRTVSPHSGPGVAHDPMIQQLLYQQQQQQHQQQQQQRVTSPMNNALRPSSIISSNIATSPSTLSIQHPVIPHRVPSPRDLVMHTQTIMQNALIKTKLEEQRENYRKRHEHQQHQHPQSQHQQQQQQRIASPVNSPSKQMMSPTPLAFTPTSVLRKMTAEKEPDGNAEASKLAAQSQAAQMQQMQSAVQLIAQGVLSRQQNAIRPQQQASSQQVPWTNQPINKHPGRPIVKGGSTNQYQYGGPVNFQSPMQPPCQQRLATGVYPARAPTSGNTARSKHTMSTTLSHQNVPQYNMTPNSVMSQRSDPMNNLIKAQPVQSHLASMQHQQRNVNSQVQLVLNQNYNSNRTDGRVIRPQQPMNMPMGRQQSPGSNGGHLSPTSNQLARWFSPELLAKARAGKLPELGQTNVLFLEELERLQQASAVVHE